MAKQPWQETIMSKSSGRRTRRVFCANFKAKVALAALREKPSHFCFLWFSYSLYWTIKSGSTQQARLSFPSQPNP
jgi:hypothetical protein